MIERIITKAVASDIGSSDVGNLVKLYVVYKYKIESLEDFKSIINERSVIGTFVNKNKINMFIQTL